MTTAERPCDVPTDTAECRLTICIAAACDRIAPTWPLDRFIAVNPYWGWRGSHISDAAATLGALSGTSLTMPRTWFRDEWSAGRLADHHLDAAAAELRDPSLAERARAALRKPGRDQAPERSRMALMTDVRDLGPGPRPGQTWTELVTHQISQHCAAYFDQGQGTWHPHCDDDIFRGWRNQFTASREVAWPRGASWARQKLAGLPAEPAQAIATMLDALNIPDVAHEHYLTALLLSVNGWAAWCAYARWQARLAGQDDHEIVALLAVRLAWEWLLYHDAAGPETIVTDWAESWRSVSSVTAAGRDDACVDWLLQAACERTYQATIVGALAHADPSRADEPAVQAVFCIDVRSEVFRRAFESVTTDVRTRGFAGFFGLPIAYTPVGSALTRPQLPGLLAPSLAVGETAIDEDLDLSDLGAERATSLEGRRRWGQFRNAPSSVFSFVESMGLTYGAKLLKDSVAHTHPPTRWEDDGLRHRDAGRLRPLLALIDGDPVAAAAAAHKVLTAMGLTDDFAPLVLLCGHGGHTTNNPHGAGLDCGACGGQSGEVNARVLADLLNSSTVRVHLAEAGITLPPTTWFIAALHNTTTDEVRLFDTDLAPDAQRAPIARLREWLDAAGVLAREERAESLSLDHLAARPDQLLRAVRVRANDWSQVRPEWGLAGNAAFIVAPRHRTRHVDFGGRCFLHDYDWRLDRDLSVLTLIMTAPMVVTNWINLQYYASTVDNRRYGSGNKVLHNVVGGSIGVFEGNGGDLRVGLPMQSLHDGHALRHPPVRLSVFIEAPRQSIDTIIRENAVPNDLIVNEWLHLLRIDPATGTVERWTRFGWTAPDTQRNNVANPTD